MSLAEALLRRFHADIGQLTLFPDFDGVFDVRVDDELIYSKHETGDFPENDAMVEKVKARL